MDEPFTLVLAVVVGGALGVVFFGGLWWTVSRALTSPLSGLWFVGSLLIRTAITLIGFTLVSRGHWERLLVCLLGFFLARLVTGKLVRGSHHAP